MKTYSNEIKEKAIILRKQNLSIPYISNLLKASKTSIGRWTSHIVPSQPTHPLYLTSKIKHDYFSKENLKNYPERLVMVGFIAADGCISDTGKGQLKLVFNLCKKDKCVLDKINEEICESSRNISFIKSTNSVMFNVSSNQICKDLSFYGIVPRKTSLFNFPNLKEPEMSYFLRGYFYGDGCCFQKGRMSMYHFVGTVDFLSNMKNYLINNSIIDTCAIHKIKNHPGYDQMHIKGKFQTAKFAKYLFANEKMKLLPRKHILLI